MAVIDEPAAAAAAGRCVTARSLAVPGRTRVMSSHPGRCAWCDYPVAELARMVEGFNAWAGWREKTRTYERHDARVFAELPRAEQERRIVEAQGLEPEPEPEPTSPPADARAHDLEDVDAWL